MTSPLPAAARLAWWGTAWLRGHVVADLVVDAVVDEQATHAVAGLADLGLGGDPTETLLGGLARLRVEGADCIGAVFGVEGDPVGLGGPPAFNAAALEAGEAVVASGTAMAALRPGPGAVGLVPVVVGAATTWVASPAARRQLPDVGEADRALRAALPAAADALAALEVARWRPEVADRLMDLRRRDPLLAPPGVPPRCVELAAKGLQAMDIAELALEDDGGALSAHEADARAAVLRPLAAAARRALVAACSPEAWPPG